MALALSAGALKAQEPAETVVDVQIEGETAPFARLELVAALQSRATRRFLGLPGVTPGRWIYELGDRVGGGVGRALERAGEAPSALDPDAVERDRARLEGLYRQEGFRDARVSVRVDRTQPERVRLTFSVDRGPLTLVRRFSYEGLDVLTAPQRAEFIGGTRLALAPRADGPLRFDAVEQPFAERALLEERARAVAFLRARGFPFVTRDSARVVVLPTGSEDAASGTDPAPVDLVFQIRPGPRAAFGAVEFVVAGPDETAPRADTLAGSEGRVRARIRGTSVLDAELLFDALAFGPGEPYDRRRLTETRRRLERTGLFAFSEILALAPDTVLGALQVPHRIELRTRPRHTLRAEGFVLQRSGLLGTETEELGLGAGVSYSNRNALGRAEQLSARLSGSVAGAFNTGFPTAEVEAQVALATPYLAGLLDLLRGLAPLGRRTRVAVSGLSARREALGVVIRGRFEASLRVELEHSPALTSVVDLVDFSLSDPDTLDGFSRRFLDFVVDPVARASLLDDYTRPQIGNAFRYTLRASTADPLRRDDGIVRELQLESGGLLTYALDRLVFTPGVEEGSLPGLPFFSSGGPTSRLEYRPYLRALGDARRYVPLGARGTLALKAIAGVAHPTGQAPVVPFDRRFYAGGGTSVRGFRLRQLGPGASAQPGAYVQGGDVKLETSVEGRYVALRRFLSADWQLAAFVDAGNVWLGPRNPGDPAGRFRADSFLGEVGVGAGYGLRIAWDFLILRFDLAHRVRSPVPGEGWFPAGAERPLFHFGIGQAF